VALVMEYLPAKLETLSSKSKYCQNINKMYWLFFFLALALA
jgi:hypothetical protein